MNSEKMRIRFQILIFLFWALTYGAASTEVSDPTISQNSYNGLWWQRTSEDETLGFLYGTEECLEFDATAKLWFDDKWDYYKKEIGEFYSRDPANLRVPVREAFSLFSSKKKVPIGLTDDDRYGDEFWRAHNDLARAGFLEGYISCRIKYKMNPKFEKPIKYYLNELNNFYNVDDRFGESAYEYPNSIESLLIKLSHGFRRP